MIRRCLLAFSCWCCLAPSETIANPLCLYNSRSFSQGAFICVQRSVMLSCASDGTRAVWKPVADQYLADRCVAATQFTHGKRLVHRARAPRAQSVAAEQASAKCFMFNGKRYCE
jgi:hypothetical protein